MAKRCSQYVACERRGSQVVRHGSAKAVFAGSIPALASFSFPTPQENPPNIFWVVSPDDDGFDLSHGFAEGTVAEMALADAEEFRAGPGFIEFFEVGDRGNSIVEAAGEQDS